MGAVQYIDGKGLRRPAKTGDLERAVKVGWLGSCFLLGLEKLLDKKTGGVMKNGLTGFSSKWNSWAFEFHFVSPPWGWPGFVYVKP